MWGKGQHQGRLWRNKCGKIEGKGDKKCKQVVVSGNALCLISTLGVCTGDVRVHMCVCARTCVCRSEYQQLDWGGGPVPYIYSHIFH